MNNTEKYLNINVVEQTEKIQSFFNDRKMRIEFKTLNFGNDMYFTVGYLY